MRKLCGMDGTSGMDEKRSWKDCCCCCCCCRFDFFFSAGLLSTKKIKKNKAEYIYMKLFEKCHLYASERARARRCLFKQTINAQRRHRRRTTTTTGLLFPESECVRVSVYTLLCVRTVLRVPVRAYALQWALKYVRYSHTQRDKERAKEWGKDLTFSHRSSGPRTVWNQKEL